MSQPEKTEDIGNVPAQQKPQAQFQETDHDGEDVSMETMSSENVDDQWHATTVLAALVTPLVHQILISEFVSLLHRHIRTLFHDGQRILISGGDSWGHDECRVDTPCLYACNRLYVPKQQHPLTNSFLAH
jgi:hypothetical protein